MAKRDADFLHEMGSLRFIDRVWTRFFFPHTQNQSEHMFRVFWIAMVLAAREGNCDSGKIAKMALLHDIGESRTGDVDMLSRQYVERNEELGLTDMLSATSIEKEFLALAKEYEERESLEAKIVKDADNLDCDFELEEQRAMGSKLPETLQDARDTIAKTKLYTNSAKELYKEIHATNAHRWFMEARNRMNAGDWRK